MWQRKNFAGIVIACAIGLFAGVWLVRYLPEPDLNAEVMAREDESDVQEPDSNAKEKTVITMVEAVEIPAPQTPKIEPRQGISPADRPKMPQNVGPIASMSAQKANRQSVKEVQTPQPVRKQPPGPPTASSSKQKPPPGSPGGAPRPESGALEPDKPISLSEEEWRMFLRTQTVDNKAKAFPRIHITYQQVDMKTQMEFYRRKGYALFAVRVVNAAITGILGEIDAVTGKLLTVNRAKELAWNYGSVITDPRYRQIAIRASGNPGAYLAVVPRYAIVNLILGSIDKGLNGKIDGDYADHRSYRAVFTTRHGDVVLTVFLPKRNFVVKRQIPLGSVPWL